MSTRSLFAMVSALTCTALASASVLQSGVPVSDSGTDNSLNYPNTARKVACGPDGTIYAAYYSDTGGIRVARSTNRGASFLPSVQVNAVAAQAEIAVDVNGVVHVAWADADGVHYSRSTDGGSSFSAPTVVNATPASSVHVAVDAPWVYIVPRDGDVLYRNGSNGTGAWSSTAIDAPRVFADVHVDLNSHDVIVVTDDPTVRMYVSADRGATFAPAVEPGVSIFYSTAVFVASESGRHLFMSGSGTDAVRINIDTNVVTNLTFGETTLPQGRTLSVNTLGNVIDGYVSNTDVVFAVSADDGATFDAPVVVAAANTLSVAINTANGDVVAIYEVGGEIFCNVYGGLVETPVVPPTVTTGNVTSITAFSALCGGEVTDAGGGDVTARGVVYNTTGDPTLENGTATLDGAGLGSFTSILANLTPNQTYHVRAYATNAAGTAYGEVQTFQTKGLPDLKLTITPEQQRALVGQSPTFLVTLENVGEGDALDVVVTLQLPANAKFVSLTVLFKGTRQIIEPDITTGEGFVDIGVGDLAAGETLEMRVALQATARGTLAMTGGASYNVEGADEPSDTLVEGASASSIEIDDDYVQVVSQQAPLCGGLGLWPAALLLAGLATLKRGRRFNG
ncbi:MAG: DUF11 domain-containing protein [Phycisphaerae bacterium]|nr:DUF11 domain-containing protein [Phycisphaerae bacterium]MCZ2400863.1 DUF11 domain-containing protein [Phycisphaerae bacterium]NUQ48786.1 DUF11 domain-containing protein [Phycisphaerae bacterium]